MIFHRVEVSHKSAVNKRNFETIGSDSQLSDGCWLTELELLTTESVELRSAHLIHVHIVRCETEKYFRVHREERYQGLVDRET